MAILQVTQKSETVNCSPAKLCWRLVHDGKKVSALFRAVGETRTGHILFCADTEAECQAEINALGLTPLTARPAIKT